jgi:hypothetical protein
MGGVMGMDRWDCYERAVQAPRETLALLVHEHGGAPLRLGEDFAGSAALARAWVASDARRSAIAVDLDAQALARAANVERLQALVADVRSVRHAPVDVLHAGNFSLGYLHSRQELLEYLRNAATRVCEGGVFACDTFGGASAFQLGGATRAHTLPDGAVLTSIWRRRAADPRTARVENVLSFRIVRDGELVARLDDAFVYCWRLWSISELSDALSECGFERPRVRASTALDEPEDAPLGEDFAVLLCARVRR